MYQDEVRGSLIEIVDKIIELIYFKYMRAKITYVGMQRRERYFVPEAALRETLLNALCHSQYNYGVPIQISVYADKMYIANVFYLAGFIESWGRGIEKICEACKADELPMPEFTVNPGDIMVKFTAPEDRVVHGPGKVTDRIGVEVGEVLSDGEKMVLELLEIDPGMTYVSMAEKLSVSEKTIYKRMKMLRDKGIIVRVGTDKQGYWKINE